MRTVSHSRRLIGAFTTALAVALLAACGDMSHDSGNHPAGQGASPAPGAEHNQADIAFAQAMIPHHGQAVEMADLAASRASSPAVKELAEKIEAAQAPEIEEMTNWLQNWGATPSPGMPGHDMGTMSPMPEMMSEQDMKALESATGAEFDAMFLEMMIVHHQGAVHMAATEQQQGLNRAAKALAAKIEADQKAEIAHMRTLRGTPETP